MGKKSRDKGGRTERAIVNLLQGRGFAAERVPLSGGAGGRYKGDVSVPLLGIDRVIEVKCRADGFTQIYDWLGDNFALVIKRDRSRPLIVLDLEAAAEIAGIAESVPDGRHIDEGWNAK